MEVREDNVAMRGDKPVGRDQASQDSVDVGAVTTLIGSLHHRNGAVRQHAREMLVDIGADAVDALILMLQEPGYLMRWEAVKALGEIGDARGAPALVDALEDPSPDVRWLAAEGLASMGREGLHVLLERLARGCGAIWLRQGAHHALHGYLASPWSSVAGAVLNALNGHDPTYTVPGAARHALDSLETASHSRR